MPKPLFMVSEDGQDWWLCDTDAFHPLSRPASPADLTPVAIAEMLDQDAENANYHSFVGKHKMLAELLVAEAGPETATKIMRTIVDWGGLHGD